MNVNNNYPHPVLGNSKDFEFNEFTLNIRYGGKNSMHQFRSVFDMGVAHDDIEKLIQENKAEYIVQVYCQKTFYREIFRGNEKTLQFDIKNEYLSGRIEYEGFLISKVTMENYDPYGLDEYFTNAKYQIFPGDILGVSNKTVHYIEPNFKKPLSNRSKAIITFKETDEFKNYYQVSKWNANQIEVKVPKKMYSLIQKKDLFQSINEFSILVTIVTEALYKIDHNPDDFEDLKWFTVIKREVEKLEINNDEDYYYKAQMLLKKPLKKYTEKLEFFDRLIENDE